MQYQLGERRRVRRQPVLRAAACALGVLTLLLWRQSPTSTDGVLLVALLAATLFWRKRAPLLAALAVGVCWGALTVFLSDRALLPPVLDREMFELRGIITSPVLTRPEYSQFDLQLSELAVLRPGEQNQSLASQQGGRLRLRIYHNSRAERPTAGDALAPGQSLYAVATLRTPRGLANPGLFNYRGWLISQGYVATGYIREHRLVSTPLRATHPIAMVEQLRQKLLLKIAGSSFKPITRALLAALAVGDKSALSEWRERIVDLGIIHLLVISGLHVGMVGALGWWLGSALVRLTATLLAWRGREAVCGALLDALPAASALLLALFYTLLSGWQLPALRALIALLWVAAASWRRWRWEPLTLLARVVVTILFIDPLAVVAASFWLSISAVLLLLLALIPRCQIFTASEPSRLGLHSLRNGWLELLRVQFYLSLGMAPLLLAVVGKLSLAGWLVNLVAVPWVTLLLVPSTLLAVAVSAVADTMAAPLWQLAALLTVPLVALIEGVEVSALLFSLDQLALPLWLLLLFFWLAVALPRSLLNGPLRLFCMMPLLLTLWSGPARPPLRVTLLDVGQGLAVVVEAGGRVLVYDSGARYGTHFDMGSAIVAPYLQRRGYRQLDRLIISHADNDHAGGLAGLLAAYPQAQLMLPDEPISGLAGLAQSIPCQSGQHWRWGEIEFSTIANRGGRSRNNNSCLLLIEWGAVRILLPGDIERSSERRLLASGALKGPLTVLLAPHHGSKSSSSAALVGELQPSYTLFSAGWNHHFGHPDGDVRARYLHAGSQLLSTAELGAIVITWQTNQPLTVTHSRHSGSRWWQ